MSYVIGPYFSTFSRIPPTEPVVIPGALGLLTGETNGFAIDATTYATAAALYTGGPAGGTVSVIDVGTPANNLSNVALDSSNLVQSGTSPKMVTFPTSPYVRWTPHNYCFRSQVIGTSPWSTQAASITADTTVAPDGTTTADTLTADGTGTAHEVLQLMSSTNVLSDVVYTYSIYAKAGTTNFVSLNMEGSSANHYACAIYDLSAVSVTKTQVGATSGTIISTSITAAANGFYRCTLTGSIATQRFFVAGLSNSGTATIDTAGEIPYTGSQTAIFWGAQIVRGYNANPHIVSTASVRIGIPQAYDTAASKYGILVEPAATNNILRSEEFDNAAWTKDGATATANAGTAPDGSTTAELFAPTATNAAHQIFQGFTSSVAAWTYSIYVKSDGGQWLGISTFSDANTDGGFFDVINGVVGGLAGSNTGTITSVGGGWYRCTLTRTLGGSNYFILEPHTADGQNNVWNATTATDFLIWGAQVELGSVATSYIPTVASTVTRARDLLATTATIPTMATLASMWTQFKPYTFTDTFTWGVWDGSGTNKTGIYNSATGPTIKFFCTSAGSGVADFSLGSAVAGVSIKASARVKLNDYQGALTGVLGVGDTSGAFPSGVNAVTLQGGSSNDVNFIYQAVIVPRAYSDAELQSITT